MAPKDTEVDCVESSYPYSRCAWKVNTANFAITEFSEVALTDLRFSASAWSDATELLGGGQTRQAPGYWPTFQGRSRLPKFTLFPIFASSASQKKRRGPISAVTGGTRPSAPAAGPPATDPGSRAAAARRPRARS